MASKLPPIPFAAINKEMEWAILTGKSPTYSFADGKRVSDTPIKWRYCLALPGNCYTPLTVSVAGSIDILSNITEEQISEACATLNPLLVSFTGCMVNIYTIGGEQRMTATADSIELLKPSK